MPEAKKIACPTCAYEFDVAPGVDITHLTCPHCEGEIPEESFQALAKEADELTPGFKAGQRLGNYVVESLLGSGGMAVVLRGRQLSLNRNVAIKILPKQLAKTKLFVTRFESEASVLAGLNHPNIVSVIDRGREGDTYFIVMEYVEGETLKQRMRREGLFRPEKVLPIALQVLAGLEYAHRRGVVHRDIKPGNIMINREEMVKIADFGLAHLAKAQGGLDVTRVGQTMGTLKYMAPEQLTNAKNIDRRADLYSVGVCLYEMLTGKLPLGTFKMPSECDNTVDLRWDDIILRTLKMEPEERFSSAEEMAHALREMAATPGRTLAQREQEEDDEIRVKARRGSLTGCANCGHESKPSARQCERCGASLADLFEACPSCKAENRVDAARCPRCGANLAANRDQMRSEAEALQAKVKELISGRQFDEALAQLEKLARFRTREYASVQESARIWIGRIRSRQERLFQQTYEAGRRLVAEGRAEQALQVWASLPETCQDVAARRKELLPKVAEADAARAEGNRLYGTGDFAGAVAAWEKAASFRPHDPELHKRLAAARVRLGNFNLKRSYMKESRQAAAQGDFIEALALCRKVLGLDPADSSALAFAKDLEAKNRELVEKEIAAQPKAHRPARRHSSVQAWLILRTVALILGAVGLVCLGLWIALSVVPESHRVADEAAARILQDAGALRDKGDISGALAKCRRIETEYSATLSAQGASDLEKELNELEENAYAAVRQAEALATGKDLPSLIRVFRRLQEVLKGPPVAAVNACQEQVKRRVEELREQIALTEAQAAADCEKKGEWQEALKRYRVAAEEFGFNREPITSRMSQAAKRLDDCASLVNAGRRAAQAGKWDEAYGPAVKALDLIPSDPNANRLLADLAPKLTPPPGMVLVPPGKYTVGGSEGNPARTLDVPHGFFMDAAEVTQARFSEFLRASRRPPPPDWREDRLPPPGAETLPAVNVTWEDAAAFAAWAGRTLPTEEQWECACRGQSGQRYPWGDAWDPAAAVLGFAPASPGAAAKDRSPCGCMDMAGNVAEWTATKQEAPADPASGAAPDSPRPAPAAPPGPSAAGGPSQPLLYVVKGNSWAGLEKGRPTTVVVSSPSDLSGASPVILTPDRSAPECLVRFPSNITMEYLGLVGEGGNQHECVLVHRWMPAWSQGLWADKQFRVTTGEPIGKSDDVSVYAITDETTGKSKLKLIPVDFSAGCVAVRTVPEQYLEFRDPAGVARRAPFHAGKLTAWAPPRIIERKEPPAPDMTLEQVVSAATRMAGRPSARYINVGFRCMKMIWTPPPAAQAGSDPGTKQN